LREAIVIFADSRRSATMRHAVPVSIGDPFLYAEVGGKRHVVVRSHEVPHVSRLDAVEVHSWEAFGLDQLVSDGIEREQATRQLAADVLQSLDVTQAVVPPDFPFDVANRIQATGIDLEVNRELFVERRRSKSPIAIASARRAQAAADAGMRAVASLLATARVEGDRVVAGSNVVTCERLNHEVRLAVLAEGCSITEFIVAHGPQTSVAGHGSGEILAGESIVVDLWPRDNDGGYYTDMTRTFVVGDVPDELVRYHELCLVALEASLARTKAGLPVRELYDTAAAVFEEAGFPTMRTKNPNETLLDGFFHNLGHGVGLDAHEPPWLVPSEGVLVENDVIAVEPGCYRNGFGGVRLEDLVLVTEDGHERFGSFPYTLDPAGALE
jgi:Xaa-Pro aminopeptidase